MSVTKVLFNRRGEAIGPLLAECMSWAQETYLCVSYARMGGLERLRLPLRNLLQSGGRLRAIFDIEKFFTDVEVIMETATHPGDSECKVFFRGEFEDSQPEGEWDEGIFHPKFYLFQRGTSCRLILGSANLTKSGMEKNVEASVVFEGTREEEPFSSCRAFFEQLWISRDLVSPLDKPAIIEQYRKGLALARRHDRRAAKRLEKLRKEIRRLSEQAKDEARASINVGSAYLAGVVAGGGEIDDSTLTISYRKGHYSGHGVVPGYISARGISEVKIPEEEAFRADVTAIRRRIEEFMQVRGLPGKVRVVSARPTRHKLVVDLPANNREAAAVLRFLRPIVKDGSLPDEFQKQPPHILWAFVRGYADVRGRISPADRAGGGGALRVALSFGDRQRALAPHLKEILERRLGVSDVGLLRGEERGRETMLRFRPDDVPDADRQRVFSLAWKRLLIDDFARYNKEHWPRRHAGHPVLPGLGRKMVSGSEK